MSQATGLSVQASYEIKVYGLPDEAWLGWFGTAQAHVGYAGDGRPVTTFAGVVLDQAGLVGLIRRLHGRGIVLISVRLL